MHSLVATPAVDLTEARAIGSLIAVLGALAALYVVRRRARTRRSLYADVRVNRERRARQLHARMTALASSGATVLEPPAPPSPRPEALQKPDATQKLERIVIPPPQAPAEPKASPPAEPEPPSRRWWERLPQPDEAPAAPEATPSPETISLPPPPDPIQPIVPVPPPTLERELEAEPAEELAEDEEESKPTLASELLSYVSLVAAVGLVVAGVFLMLAIKQT